MSGDAQQMQRGLHKTYAGDVQRGPSGNPDSVELRMTMLYDGAAQFSN